MGEERLDGLRVVQRAVNAAAGEIPVRHERHDPILPEPLGELPAHVLAREVDDVDPEPAPVLEEELEEPVGLQVLGHRHHGRHADPHRPAADVPVPRVRQRDHDPLPVCQTLLDVLDAFEPERVEHLLIAPAEDVERVEPVPPIEGERLAGGGLDQRVLGRAAEDLSLVRGDGRSGAGREAVEEQARPLVPRSPAPRRQDLAEPAHEAVHQICRRLDGRPSSVHAALSSWATCPARTTAASPDIAATTHTAQVQPNRRNATTKT